MLRATPSPAARLRVEGTWAPGGRAAARMASRMASKICADSGCSAPTGRGRWRAAWRWAHVGSGRPPGSGDGTRERPEQWYVEMCRFARVEPNRYIPLPRLISSGRGQSGMVIPRRVWSLWSRRGIASIRAFHRGPVGAGGVDRTASHSPLVLPCPLAAATSAFYGPRGTSGVLDRPLPGRILPSTGAGTTASGSGVPGGAYGCARNRRSSWPRGNGGPDASAVGFAQLYPTFSSLRLSRMWVLNDLYTVADAPAERGGASAACGGADHGRGHVGHASRAAHRARPTGRRSACTSRWGICRDELFYRYEQDLVRREEPALPALTAAAARARARPAG